MHRAAGTRRTRGRRCARRSGAAAGAALLLWLTATASVAVSWGCWAAEVNVNVDVDVELGRGGQEGTGTGPGAPQRELFYRVEDLLAWLNGGGGGDGGVPDRTDPDPNPEDPSAPSPSVGVPLPPPPSSQASPAPPSPPYTGAGAGAGGGANRTQVVSDKCGGLSLSDRSEALRQAILDQTVTTAGRLDDSGTAQYEAFRWIDESDPLALCPDSPSLVQRYTLAVLFSSLGGAAWTDSNNWMTDSYVCDWHGVTCSTADSGDGIVTRVSLKSNNLQGFLPSEIFALPTLEGLSLDHNAIRGEIPSTLGLATTLQYIELDDNSLRGTFPSEFYQLAQLQAIDLNTNRLSGTISSDIRNLSQLVVLQLEQNRFTGSVPSAALRQLNDLVLLTLHDNDWAVGSSLESVCDYVPARRQSNPAYLQFFSADCATDPTNYCPCCSQCF